MRFSLHSLRLLALALPLQVSISSARSLQERATSVGDWVAGEIPIALSGLFRNIGSSGEFAKTANVGAVIASPSTIGPD